MKIDGDITILADNQDGTVKIEISDRRANTTFCRIKMTSKQFVQAMGRLSNVKPKSMEVHGLENLGKKHECKQFEFPIGNDVTWDEREEVAREASQRLCPVGWQADNYFNSQNSFFRKSEDPDFKEWARCTIRRYV
jgi:hypothetical protein